jgi:hypothetical protein
LLTKLKQRVQFWITAEAKLAHSIGLTPNQVSATGIALAVLSALAYWKWHSHALLLVLAPLLLLASGFCDALDGALARLYGEATAFGGFLDSLRDHSRRTMRPPLGTRRVNGLAVGELRSGEGGSGGSEDGGGRRG